MSSYPPIIEVAEANQSYRRFPMVAQLGILVVILGVAFLATWNPVEPDSTPDQARPTPLAQSAATTERSPLPAIAADSLALTARAAYVWDIAGQRALFTKNHTEVFPLASITKLMTALLAYELIDEQSVTTVPLAAIRQPGHSGLAAGEQLTQEMLMQLALITSSNDAAYALAHAVGERLGPGPAVQQFVTAMNVRADELGYESLSFFNPTGLDESATQAGGYGTARDVSFLMEYIVQNYPELLEPTRQEFTRVYNEAGAHHNALNTNRMVTAIPNIIGSKTGFTDLAGGNLTVVVDVGFNRPVVITVLGSTRSERFTDVLAIHAALTQ